MEGGKGREGEEEGMERGEGKGRRMERGEGKEGGREGRERGGREGRGATKPPPPTTTNNKQIKGDEDLDKWHSLSLHCKAGGGRCR